MGPKIILVDFDGVLHSYTSPWSGPGVVSDPPVPGAIEWLRAMLADPRFDVCIYSSRSKHDEGVLAMGLWLQRHGLSVNEVRGIQFPVQKPAAFLTIDDRCIRFEGTFPSPDEVDGFLPWNKRGI